MGRCAKTVIDEGLDPGVTIDTVRYYERSGLLAPAGRLASGYRRHGVRALLALSDERNVAEARRAAKAG